MRYSVFTLAFPGRTVEELIDLSAWLGFNGIDLRIADDEHLGLDAPVGRRREVLARANGRGIHFSAAYSYLGGRLVDPDPAIRADEVDRIRRLIDLASDLEAPLVRIWSNRIPRTEENLVRFVEACRPAAAYARQAGVLIGMPNHNDLAYDAESCRRLVEGIGPAGVGIIYDPPNIERTGLDPIREGAGMWEYVCRVELKDWRLQGPIVPGAAEWVGVDAVPLGQGEASLGPVVDFLKQRSYDGWICDLYESRWHPAMPDPAVGLAADLAYLRRAFTT